MKFNAIYRWSVCLVLLGMSLAGCLKYKDVPACELRAGFTVQNDTIIASGPTAEVIFIDSSRTFTGLVYEWNFQDNSGIETNLTPGTTHTFVPRNSEPYRVLLTVRLGEGCIDTFSRNIWVFDGGPVANFTTDKAGNMCFTNELVTFTSQSTNADTLIWDFGDGSPQVKGSTVQYSYPVANDYMVRHIAIRGIERDTVLVIFKVNALKFGSPGTTLGPARRVKQLPDRSYALVGNTKVGTQSKPYLLFVDEQGNVTRTISITTVGADATVVDFTALSNGTFALAGTTNRNLGSTITQDIFYVLLDASGNEISTLGLPAEMRTDGLNESASSIIATANGGVMITGRVSNPLANTSDIYIFKSKTNLDNIDINQAVSLPNYEEGISVVEVSGGFIIVGQTRINAFSNSPDILVLKVNAFGAIIGTPQVFGGSAGEYAASVAKAPNGLSLMICGLTTTNGNEDFYLVKTDINGIALMPPKTITDPLSVQQTSKEISPTANGGFMIAGIQGGNPCFFTIDSDGNNNPIKTYSLNGTEGFNSGVQTSDGGFIFAGYLENTKLLLLKTDKTGNFN